MAKILCGISGIEFTCEHLPIYLDSREYAHPVFFLPQKKLLGLFQKYRHAELGPIDSYLVFLAYLNSTDLVEFRVPAQRTPGTESIVANNFEHLVDVCCKINTIKNPSIKFAHIAVSPENKTLDNVNYWLLNWEDTYCNFKSGYAAQKARQELVDIEEKLDSLAADANKSEVQFASRLAEWADKAGSFPRFPVTINSHSIPCNEYWKQIIRKCVNSDSIFGVNARDLQELTDHCYDNIEVGSTYAHWLFATLKEGATRHDNFLGIANFTFSIVSNTDSIEQANRTVIIENAPTSEPKRIAYPSQFAYIKAKLAWEMAQAEREKALVQVPRETPVISEPALEPEIELDFEPELDEISDEVRDETI